MATALKKYYNNATRNTMQKLIGNKRRKTKYKRIGMRKGQRFLFCLEVRVFSEVEGGFESFGNFLKKKKKRKMPQPSSQ